MINTNARVTGTLEKIKQLDRQRILKENREWDAARKIGLRREIIVGEIFIKHFPVALDFNPCRTEMENSIEFAPLEDFIAALAGHQELLRKLESELSQKPRNG